jgi:hypothetical protein
MSLCLWLTPVTLGILDRKLVQRKWELFATSLGHASLGRRPLRLVDHPCVGGEADNLPENAGERKRHGARSAADVEKPVATINPERSRTLGQPWSM